MFHHPIPLVPRRLLARCGGHARESGVVRSLIKLNNIISLVRERSLLRSLVHYFSWGKRACRHGHYSVFRVSPYSATPLQGCMPPHTENHWPMPVGPSVGRSLCRSVGRSFGSGRSAGRSVGRSLGRSFGRSVGRTDRAQFRTRTRSVGRSVALSVCR